MQKKFHIITLGCKVNQYESQALREAWLKAGHQELASAEGADLVLINSCAITDKAVVDLRALSRRVRKLAPDCELLVTGCAAQALPGELEELPVDTLVPQSEKLSLLRWLKPVEQNILSAKNTDNIDGNFDPALEFALLQAAHNGPDSHADTNAGEMYDFWANAGVEETPSTERSNFPAFSISDYARSRAVLKIHDGCSQHCTYCIVPQGRGPSVSRPWAESIAEAARLVQAGFREIVINGVNLRQYGSDLNPPEDFWDFILRLEAAFSSEAGSGLRFRISSLEPGQLGQKALDILGKSRLIAPHLHLSLQSGSPRTLKHMGRGHYDPYQIPGFLKQLTQIWPVFGLGADFIAGFPGESEQDFAETMALSKELPMTYAHVFPYSRRPGTAAAKLPDQIPQQTKKDRAAKLRNLISSKKDAFLEQQLNLPELAIAPEERDDAKGIASRGVNEYYVDCRFEHPVQLSGKQLVAVLPVRVEKQILVVEKI